MKFFEFKTQYEHLPFKELRTISLPEYPESIPFSDLDIGEFEKQLKAAIGERLESFEFPKFEDWVSFMAQCYKNPNLLDISKMPSICETLSMSATESPEAREVWKDIAKFTEKLFKENPEFAPQASSSSSLDSSFMGHLSDTAKANFAQGFFSSAASGPNHHTPINLYVRPPLQPQPTSSSSSGPSNDLHGFKEIFKPLNTEEKSTSHWKYVGLGAIGAAAAIGVTLFAKQFISGESDNDDGNVD